MDLNGVTSLIFKKVAYFETLLEDEMKIQEIHKKQRAFFKTQQSKNVLFRKDSLKRFQSVLQQEEKAITTALKQDLGKAEFEAYLTEYYVVMAELKTMLKNLELWSKPKRVKSSLLNFPSKDYLIPEPYGNLLQISPWNYPFQLSLATVVGAVAAGNTVVLKPSEHAPKTAALLAQLVEKAFEPEHVTVVNGDASTAKELLDLRWDHIMFTGSTHIGKIIAKAAAEHLTPTILELGGKNPCVVDQTAPIQLTAKRIVWGKYVNCGQTCIAPDYLLVQKGIKDQLLEAIVKEIKAAYGEDAASSSSYGRIAHQKHFDRLVDMIKNETLIHGGNNDAKSRYLEPTLLEVNDSNHPTMQEEIFGPILPVICYEKEEEIHAIIEQFERPLGFYVFSKRKKFIQQMFAQYSYGGGVANDTMIQFANDKLPFGGVGHSGIGAYHGKYSFDAFTHYKPFIQRGTWNDPSIRYAPFPTNFDWLKKLLNRI
ncbi:MAG: aldehyde dehydrogenase [Flavobacteriaceae bacterium]